MTAQLTAGALLAQGARRLSEAQGAPEASALAPRLPAHAREALPRAPQAATASLDAQLLLAYALSAPRARVIADLERIPSAAEARHYAALLERRAAGEPLAYILGHKEFWSLSLKVGPEVLVPRPETELLVERALTLRSAASGRVADLGTGSGAIALALAVERPQWELVATDISADALATAKGNAAALNLRRIEFVLGNWFEPLEGRVFDLLVSNPPYVADSDPAMHDRALGYEPRLALTPGGDALLCLREIIRSAPDHLEQDGWLLLEHGADQATDVARELVGRGFRSVRSHRDLAGHDRVTEAQRS